MSSEQPQRSELRSRIQQRLQQRTDTTTKSSPKTFNQLPPYLQNVLPDNYTYIIKSYKELPLCTFDGAPNASFDAQFYINIASIDEIEAWRQAFHTKTGTIFRITRADKVKGIKVIYHKDFHCRHADIAAIKYMQKTYAQKAGQRRSRNTNCQCLAKIRLEKSRLSLSHPCEVRMVYNHNHRVEPDQSKNNNNITTTTLNSHIMSSTLVPPPFLHETSPPSIGTTPLGTPLIGTPSDTTTVSAQSSPRQEFADFGYGLSHSSMDQKCLMNADVFETCNRNTNQMFSFSTVNNSNHINQSRDGITFLQPTITTTDTDNTTTSTNLLPSLSSTLQSSLPFSHTSTSTTPLVQLPISTSTSTSPLLPFSQPPISTSTSTTPPLPTTNNRYHSPPTSQKLLTALTQFARETEADILAADPYYNNSLYKFFTVQNKARSHSLEMAAQFFDSFSYIPAYEEYPGAGMGIELLSGADYLGMQYQQPQPQQDQKTYQSYDFCQESNAILDQQYQQYQSDLSQGSDPFAISRKRKHFELGSSYFDMPQPRRKRDCLSGTERASQLNVTSENEVDRLGLGYL
ncbi:7058_t:CDS:1 [Paraglomus brasilianum]|uniref:7058_t:CDS:1 n=1 Tax=Paraglomus brasilianum TaxID=144538 RepID=A0A9N8VDD3_9GLOM|nr:7058_t:CDS:1 [Paraglomus brasilianum]